MTKSHLKRIVAPKTWILLRKQNKFITRPSPGAHSMKFSIPLSFLLKEIGLASTTAEAKKILNTKTVLIDGRRVKNIKFPVGLMDTVNIKDVNGFFRIVLDIKGRLKILGIKENEVSTKLSRVNNKTVIKKSKLQLNLFDGKNILADDKEIKTGDSLVLELPSQKIKSVLKFEKNAFVLLIGGRHIGQLGFIDDFKESFVKIRSEKNNFNTQKRFVFVVGKDKEVVQLK
ncbi:30S ribosomal protein S4e [Candidatus Woesearchaeota archaeon]|nr:30S ribosomal protein S4e [Candidatus Woesearchaeota archaeon]